MINAGAIAKDGIAKNNGEKITANRNSTAVTTAVRPVLPPAVTPEALSTKVVVVDVPNNAPTLVAIASDSSAGLCGFRRIALCEKGYRQKCSQAGKTVSFVLHRHFV